LACSSCEHSSRSVSRQVRSSFSEALLTVRTRSGVHQLTVEVTTTPEEQRRWLMSGVQPGPNRGMIFLLDPPGNVVLRTPQARIPLDSVFIGVDHSVVSIADATAGETLTRSIAPVLAVLWIGQGRAAELGIRRGDAVEWHPPELCCKP
jgi:uncharacterized membrane protein (UPF0127 family)